jgi:prephenate dehydrogenase
MKPTIGIIGYGRFGKLWARCLRPFGMIKIFDKKRGLHSSPAVRSGTAVRFAPLRDVVKADLLFLLVPISQMENICKKIAPLLTGKTVVIDACSVKVEPVKAMKKWLPKRQNIIATHPLFGPDSVKRFGLKNRKIVVCNVNATQEQLRSFEAILRRLGLNVIPRHATMTCRWPGPRPSCISSDGA